MKNVYRIYLKFCAKTIKQKNTFCTFSTRVLDCYCVLWVSCKTCKSVIFTAVISRHLVNVLNFFVFFFPDLPLSVKASLNDDAFTASEQENRSRFKRMLKILGKQEPVVLINHVIIPFNQSYFYVSL